MKAAIYARKSTDDNDQNMENKSVTRQIERSRAYAVAKGWSVDHEHIYVDDGISGAEFRNRPALLRMLNHLRTFDVIVMSELSRLGREMTHTATVLAQIRAAGVRVWFYLTDEELKFDSATDKFMVSAMAFAAELEREKASQRSRDALLRKAERGFNAGGRVYGYDNAPVFAIGANGQQVRSHVEYQVNQAEAEIVRRMFTMYANGHGIRVIARTVNGDPTYRKLSLRYFGGQTPPPPWKGTGSWAPSTIREMLHRIRYTGKVPYGEYRKVLRAGSCAREKQDSHLLADRPELRIVDEDLWDLVQARLRGARQSYLAATRGELHGRPETRRASKYLLSGLMRCACCSGNMVITTIALGSGRTRRREPYYICSYHHNRGSTVCSNNRKAPLGDVDGRVVNAIESIVLTPQAINYVVNQVVERVLAAQQAAPDRVKQIDGDLRRLRSQLDRFVSLIANGRAPERVLEEITGRELQIDELDAERIQLQTASTKSTDVAQIRALALRRARDLHKALRADVPAARLALGKLLANPIMFKPDGSGYRLEGQTRVRALFAPDPPITRIRLASPTRFELVLPP